MKKTVKVGEKVIKMSEYGREKSSGKSREKVGKRSKKRREKSQEEVN